MPLQVVGRHLNKYDMKTEHGEQIEESKVCMWDRDDECKHPNCLNDECCMYLHPCKFYIPKGLEKPSASNGM